MADFNESIIAEFRANEGRVGGPFQGASIVLVHHVGRKTGKEYVSPVAYLPDADDADTIYIFASKAGAPQNPAWYGNLMAAGKATVEVGTSTYPVTVSEVTGEERDLIYAEQVRRLPGFGEYEAKTEGIRTIPVVRLKRG